MSIIIEKSINWLVEKFTSIDFPKPQPVSEHRQSSTRVCRMIGGKEKENYLLSETIYDGEGRPHRTRMFDNEGEIEEEQQHRYEENKEALYLFEQDELMGSLKQLFSKNGAILEQRYVDELVQIEELTSYEYDENERLVKLTKKEQPLREEVDATLLEPLLEMRLIWQEDKLLRLEELEEEKLIAKTVFEYNGSGQLEESKRFVLEEQQEQLESSQSPKFDDKGQLKSNQMIYYDLEGKTVSELNFRYWYGDNGALIKMVSRHLSAGRLDELRTFFYNENSDLIKLEDGYHGNKDVDIKEVSYST